MSAYDPNLDRLLWEKKVEVEGKTLDVCVRSYNGGPEKVAVTEPSRKEPGKNFPVKRMTLPQLEAVYNAVKSRISGADPFEPPAEEPF